MVYAGRLIPTSQISRNRLFIATKVDSPDITAKCQTLTQPGVTYLFSLSSRCGILKWPGMVSPILCSVYSISV